MLRPSWRILPALSSTPGTPASFAPSAASATISIVKFGGGIAGRPDPAACCHGELALGYLGQHTQVAGLTASAARRRTSTLFCSAVIGNAHFQPAPYLPGMARRRLAESGHGTPAPGS